MENTESIDLGAKLSQDAILALIKEQSQHVKEQLAKEQSEQMSSLQSKVSSLESKLDKQGKKIRQQQKKINQLQEDRQMKMARVTQLEESMENVKSSIEKHGRFSAFICWTKLKKGVVTEIDQALHPCNVAEFSSSSTALTLSL